MCNTDHLFFYDLQNYNADSILHCALALLDFGRVNLIRNGTLLLLCEPFFSCLLHNYISMNIQDVEVFVFEEL